MQTARVIGTAVASQKHPTLVGQKLLVVQAYLADGVSPDGDPQIVVDAVGAGKGERVMITSDGLFARTLVGGETSPIRWAAIGICDD